MAEVTIPTEEEIEQLPRWAKVAFAARCARMILPLYTKRWPDAPKKYVGDVKQAVYIAERSASSATAITMLSTVIVANNAADAARTIENANKVGAYVIATAAAATAMAALNVDDNTTPVANVAAYASLFNSENRSQVRNDFETILNKSRLEKWTDDTPVPPSVFGPLNDIENDEHVVMALRAFGEPGVPASTLAEQMLAVYKALNVYTLAKYGKHLSRGEFRRLVLQNAGVPA